MLCKHYIYYNLRKTKIFLKLIKNIKILSLFYNIKAIPLINNRFKTIRAKQKKTWKKLTLLNSIDL